jgi:hypothetical protein
MTAEKGWAFAVTKYSTTKAFRGDRIVVTRRGELRIYLRQTLVGAVRQDSWDSVLLTSTRPPA